VFDGVISHGFGEGLMKETGKLGHVGGRVFECLRALLALLIIIIVCYILYLVSSSNALSSFALLFFLCSSLVLCLVVIVRNILIVWNVHGTLVPSFQSHWDLNP
jgi:membrane protein YdbS with pleckstrin-like domain